MRSLRRQLWVLPLLCALSASAETAPPAPFSDQRVLSSSHFKVWHESAFAPAGILNTLERLHAKLLLDLQSFAPWAKTETIEVYLYKDKAAYAHHTGAPAWSGGHVNLMEKKVYVSEGDSLEGVLAHEMGHLFFDRFFAAKDSHAPTWLTEGVAVLMEWDYIQEREKDFISRSIKSKDIEWLPLGEFLHFDYHHEVRSSAEVSQWYNQAYSLTRFLMRRFSNAQFVDFCTAVRDEEPLEEALRGAYGLQMPDVAALDRLWKQSLKDQ